MYFCIGPSLHLISAKSQARIISFTHTKGKRTIQVNKRNYPRWQFNHPNYLDCLLIRLNLNFNCDSITNVEIEETCPFFGEGRDHRGLGKISTSKKHSLPY